MNFYSLIEEKLSLIDKIITLENVNKVLNTENDEIYRGVSNLRLKLEKNNNEIIFSDNVIMILNEENNKLFANNIELENKVDSLSEEIETLKSNLIKAQNREQMWHGAYLLINNGRYGKF